MCSQLSISEKVICKHLRISDEATYSTSSWCETPIVDQDHKDTMGLYHQHKQEPEIMYPYTTPVGEQFEHHQEGDICRLQKLGMNFSVLLYIGGGMMISITSCHDLFSIERRRLFIISMKK